MLPDFPEVKNRLGDRLIRRVKCQLAQEDPFLARIRHHRIFEGHDMIVTGPDGWRDKIKCKKLQASASLSYKEIEGQDTSSLTAQMGGIAGQFAEQRAKLFFNKIDEVTEATGNVVKTAVPGSPKPDDFFQMIKTIQWDFDENGAPVPYTFVSTPEGARRFYAVLEQIDSDPALKQQYEEIMAVKRDQWRVREAHRKLVD